MDDPRMNEIQETGESQEQVSEISRQLNDATFEPEARVETSGTFEQAEAVQTTFVEVVQTAAADEISAIPLPIPSPASESSADEVSGLPVPLPSPAGEPSQDEISATPIPLPHPPEVGGSEEVSGLPIPIPGPAEDEISATPIPLPHPPIEDTQDEISATPIPLPDPAGDEGATPLPIPEPVDDRAGDFGATPLPIPEPVDDEAAKEGYIPIPLPEPAEGGNFAETLPDDVLQAGEAAQVDLVNPEQVPDLEGQLHDSELPGMTGEGPLPGGIGGRGEIPGMGGMPGEIPGMGGMPGSDLPGVGGMPGEIPGMGGMPGTGNDVPGDIRGGIGGGMGGLPDGLGGSIPGGFGFGNLPGSDQPFGDPSGGGMPGGMGGMGGMGGFPGGGMPGAGNDMPGGGIPGRPGQGEMMDGPGGGGGGGGGLFWSWNFNPEQQSRFQHAREITQMDESMQDLNYDENWTPEPAVGKGDLIDPFTGNYEEWGTATSSDYDEVEKDQENFAQAQRDYEDEKAKQQEAKDYTPSDDDDDDDDSGGGDDNQQSTQAQGALQSTTPDDEGGGGGATVQEAGRFNWQRLGGLLVFDPPRPDMDTGDQAASYDPGGVSQTAYTPEEGGGGGMRPAGAGLKVDPSVITDPDQEQTGKEAANKDL